MVNFILPVIYDGSKEIHISDLATAEVSTTGIIIAYEAQCSYFSTFSLVDFMVQMLTKFKASLKINNWTTYS